MKKFIRIAAAITLATTVTSAFAQYRFNYSLQGSLPQIGHNNGQGSENTPETPKPTDGNYRCDTDDGEGGTYFGQCMDGKLLGDDGSGNAIIGTCSKGSYSAYRSDYQERIYSGQCNVIDAVYPSSSKEGTFACQALDKDFNEINAQCTEGVFSGEDGSGNPLTGYCRDTLYTMTDKDFNVINGVCN